MQYERIKKNNGSIFITFINIFMVFFLLSILPRMAFSLPEVKNIEGQFSSGSNIKITGALFGVNGPNLVIFDDFEGGANGAPIKVGSGSAEYGQWNSTANTTSIYYTTSTSVSGKLSFQADQSKDYTNWLQANLPKNTKDVFISWWLYIPAGDNIPGEGNKDGRNWKQMWIQGDSPWDDDLVVPTLHSSWQINGNEGDPGYANYTSVNFVKGEWKHLWVWLKGGYQNNGQCHFWELLNSGVVQRENDNNVNTLKNGGAFEKVRVNAYGRQASNSHPTFDDVYIASGPNARARIEIGNKSSYLNCTKLSIITPISWNDTEIQATVRQGIFKDGDTAYLFVVDASGTPSEGHGPITIGEGFSGPAPAPPPPTDNPPNVNITSPTNNNSFDTSENSITLMGTASDDKELADLTCNIKGAYISGDLSNWSIEDIALQEGENIITVTATDTNGQSSADTISIYYTSSSGGDMAKAWSATEQTGDYTWKNSSVTRCLRLLIEGSSINQAGTTIRLGFKGRSSGDYKIKKVSIAKRDTSGEEGDVINDTWKEITFNGKTTDTWDSDEIIVGEGSEKLSDPISFSVKTGTDYYVTFIILSPSVYLNPTAYYSELYFENDDYTSKLDWSATGYLTAQKCHTFSKIYVLADDDTTPPGEINSFTATADNTANNLTWTNPGDNDFAGTVIRYRTDTYPTDPTDGQKIYEGTDYTYVHTGLQNDTTYYYSAFALDNSGNYSGAAYTKTIPANQAPVVSISANPETGESPLDVDFKVVGSDNDGWIVSYDWDFGDGNTSSWRNPSNTYDVDDTYNNTYDRVENKTTYNVTLTVTDNDGETSEATTTIEILPDTTSPDRVKGVRTR